MEGERPTVIINSTGNRTTPSVVGFTEKGDRLVGQPARHQQVTNPQNTVFSIKRFMGRRHSEVEHEEKRIPIQADIDRTFDRTFEYHLRLLLRDIKEQKQQEIFSRICT